MNDFHSLAKKLRLKVKKLDDVGNDIAIIAGIAVIKELVYRTPVDTSQAISNWQAFIGSPKDKIINAHFVGNAGSTRFQSAEETTFNAIAILKSKKPGQKIYISNSLDYIKDLNDGSSSQAPAGFVEAAVMVAKQVVRSKASLRKL